MAHNELVATLADWARKQTTPLRIVDLGCGDAWLATRAFRDANVDSVPRRRRLRFGGRAGPQQHSLLAGQGRGRRGNLADFLTGMPDASANVVLASYSLHHFRATRRSRSSPIATACSRPAARSSGSTPSAARANRATPTSPASPTSCTTTGPPSRRTSATRPARTSATPTSPKRVAGCSTTLATAGFRARHHAPAQRILRRLGLHKIFVTPKIRQPPGNALEKLIRCVILAAPVVRMPVFRCLIHRRTAPQHEATMRLA